MPLLDAGFPDGDGVTGGEWLVRHGPTIMFDIGFDPGFDPSSETKPKPAVTGVPALVDTGALERAVSTRRWLRSWACRRSIARR